MNKLYEIFDTDEETPVQYVGVYTTHWQPEWGQPEVMFREVDEPDATEDGSQWDYDEAMRQYDIQQKRACEAEAREARLKASVVRWVSKWNRTVDDLTATKGEVARLRARLEQAHAQVTELDRMERKALIEAEDSAMEVGRLREALERMIMPILIERLMTEGDHYQTLPDNLPVNTGATYGDVRRAIAALSTPAERNAQAAEVLEAYMDAPDDGETVDAPPMQFSEEV